MKTSSKVFPTHNSAGSQANFWEFFLPMEPAKESLPIGVAESQGSLWPLQAGRIFLNHGSYGACPQTVLNYQSELRAQLESSPVDFMSRRYPQLLSTAREQVAHFLGARPDHLVFVSNATTGVNAVLRSLEWKPGDEILLTDHGYNACHNVLRYLSQTRGLTISEVLVPFPQVTNSEIVDAVLTRVTDRTKLVLLDHVSSPTALIFPIAELAGALAERGVKVLVDGAHGAGMLDLNLEKLGTQGVAYYTGNLHKWCCSPKGAGFLWVSQADQAGLHPPVISHGFNSTVGRSRFHEEFDWCGTFDPTAWLAAPAALDFLGRQHPGGWPALRQHCHALLTQGRQQLLSCLPPQPWVPATMLGQMASLRLPLTDPVVLYRRLYDEFQIDSMITTWKGLTLLRISAAAYNQLSDYQALAQALAVINKDPNATPNPHL